MAKKKTEALRGKEIRFIGGVHEGKTGWINQARKPKGGWVYVIVKEENEVDGSFNQYPTHVQLFSIADPLPNDPRNDADAFLQYHKDIDKVVWDLTKRMSKCQVKAGDKNFLKDFDAIFRERLVHCISIQEKFEHKALYRRNLPDRP